MFIVIDSGENTTSKLSPILEFESSFASTDIFSDTLLFTENEIFPPIFDVKTPVAFPSKPAPEVNMTLIFLDGTGFPYLSLTKYHDYYHCSTLN